MSKDKKGFEYCDQVFTVSDEYRKKLPEVVNEISKTCSGDLGIEHIGAISIPSKESIIEILNILEDILYPGYFGEQQLSQTNLGYYIGTTALSVFTGIVF